MRVVFRLGTAVHPVELGPAPEGGWRATAGGRTLAAALREPAAPHAAPPAETGAAAAGSAGAGGVPGGGPPLAGSARTLVVDLDGSPCRAVAARDGKRWWIALGGDVVVLDEVDEDEPLAAGTTRGPLEIVSPIPGRVLKVLVAAGDRVEAGQVVVSVEAMKMENGLRAERTGRVARVLVAAGDRVEPGQVLVELAADDGPAP